MERRSQVINRDSATGPVVKFKKVITPWSTTTPARCLRSSRSAASVWHWNYRLWAMMQPSKRIINLLERLRDKFVSDAIECATDDRIGWPWCLHLNWTVVRLIGDGRTTRWASSERNPKIISGHQGTLHTVLFPSVNTISPQNNHCICSCNNSTNTQILCKSKHVTICSWSHGLHIRYNDRAEVLSEWGTNDGICHVSIQRESWWRGESQKIADNREVFESRFGNRRKIIREKKAESETWKPKVLLFQYYKKSANW